jgi:hypothetical protein
VYRYGRTETVHLAERACIWYGSFGNTPGRCVLVRELGSSNAYDLALFTLDQTGFARRLTSIPGGLEPGSSRCLGAGLVT